MSLTKRTFWGAVWSAFELLLRRGITVIVTLLLAYFIAPDEYALLAMMAIFITLGSSLMDAGISQAIVRLKNTTDQHLNTAFFSNIGFGLLAYALLWCLSPTIASFYDQPSLVVLIRVAALTIVFNALHTTHSALLTRQLQFKTQLKASVPAAICSAIVAITLALLGFGIWAVIAQTITAAIVQGILIWHFCRWRPSLNVCPAAFSALFGFGNKMFASSVLDIVFNNLYVIVIAKQFTVAVTGMYFFAANIKMLITQQLIDSLQKATYPALSSKQDDDKTLKKNYQILIRVTTFLFFPMMLVIALSAPALFSVFLPDNWAHAAHYLQLMCLATLLYPLHAINLNLLKVKGRSDLFLFVEIIKKAIIAIVLLITYQYSIEAIICGQLIASILCYFPNAFYAKRLIGYSISEQITDFMPALLLTFTVAAVHFYVSYWLSSSVAITLGLLAPSLLINYAVIAKRLHFPALDHLSTLKNKLTSTEKQA